MYPFPRFAKASEENLPNIEMAQNAFNEHDCKSHPKRAKKKKKKSVD